MIQTSHARAVVLAIITACAGAVLASDPPHWVSTATVVDCTSQCHLGHHALGGALTAAASNVSLCQSCHNTTDMSDELAISNATKAVPGSLGSSHAFDVAAINAAYGAQLPQHAEMALRVMDGKLVCSTCHNQHSAEAANLGTPRVAPAEKVAFNGGTGVLSSGGRFTGPDGLWYLVEIVQTGSESTARFRYSKDNGLSWTPAETAPCTTADPSACLVASALPAALDNGVTVSFSGGNNTFRIDERWEFSASYPFLRAVLDSGDNVDVASTKFCRDCHRDWVMDHTSVRVYDGNPKSHPVGITLGASGAAYDRTQPLDGNGQAQGATASDRDKDGNPSNDLRLDANGLVQCLSCHGVHNADGNTLTGGER